MSSQSPQSQSPQSQSPLGSAPPGKSKSRGGAVFSVLTLILALAALVVGGMAFVQTWMNQDLEEPAATAVVEIGDVAGVPAAVGDVVLDLSARDVGGNTQVLWHCGKLLMGTRHDYAAAWTGLQGALLYNPSRRELRAGELHVTVGAMRGDGEHPAPNALINTVRDHRWFLEDEHPTAVFRASTATPRAEGEAAGFEGAVEGWTHTLVGTFRLNGVERELSVAAKVDVAESGVSIDAVFPVSRSEFKIANRGGYEPPAEVDDQVLVEVRIRASRDPLSVIAELNAEVVALQQELGQVRQQAADATTRLDRFETGADELRRELARLAAELAAAKAAGLSGGAAAAALPERFTDFVDYRNRGGDERYSDLGYEPTFEMVLVPGDPEQGVDPFYVQTTEVSWEMFRAWSYCEDLVDQAHQTKLLADLLRPSPCYDDASRGHGFGGRAALGVSRRNALAFCRYVSERTGRQYRLMTDAEWHYIAEATGGLPADPLAVGWFAENNEGDDFGDPVSMPIGTKPADSLGLHDFWGNVAEWVMAGDEYVRGGSYLIESDELTLEWREDASQDIWNETYPNTPKSLWWYRDRFDMGFRLVCDPVNIPKGE